MGFTQILILIEVWWFYTNTNINRGVMGFTQILILIEVWWVYTNTNTNRGVMGLHKY